MVDQDLLILRLLNMNRGKVVNEPVRKRCFEEESTTSKGVQYVPKDVLPTPLSPNMTTL